MAEDEIRQHVSNGETHKSLLGCALKCCGSWQMGLGGRSKRARDVPEDWKKASSTWAEEQCSGWKSG